MSGVDLWTIAALLTTLALFASIRLSLPNGPSLHLGRIGDLLTHPGWMIPFILMMGMAIGWMIKGQLSPWPLEAGRQFAQRGGTWAGVTGCLLVTVVDLWLLWTPSIVARRFAAADMQAAMRGLSVINLTFGAIFLMVMHFVAR